MLQKKNSEESLQKIIEDKIGDYIDWYSAIDMAMQNEILKHEDADLKLI
jgi:hypothetical protein